MKQASGDHCGTTTSVLRSLTIILLITQVLAVSQAKFFKAVFPTTSWIKKLGVRPQQQPIHTSQIAQDVLDQTEMIHQDVPKTAMQAYIKYKAFYDKEVHASKLKKADYLYVLQPKADYQGSRFPLTEFRWIGPYIIEKVLPNNNYLVREIGINRTQVLHRMRMRQFTTHQPPAYIRSTRKKWKPDPKVSIKHDDLIGRAWECENEQPIFDAKNNNATPPNSLEFPIQFDLSTEEMRNTPGTAHKCSPEFFSQTEQLCDVTDTYSDTEPDVETGSKKPNNTPTNRRSSKYILRHNPKPSCYDDYI